MERLGDCKLPNELHVVGVQLGFDFWLQHHIFDFLEILKEIVVSISVDVEEKNREEESLFTVGGVQHRVSVVARPQPV